MAVTPSNIHFIQASNIQTSMKQHSSMTLFVDQLTVMDFSYLHVNRGIVGDSWLVDVNLDGKLNEQGMIFDFGQVKKQLKAEIDNSLDHKLVIPNGLPSLEVIEDGQSIEVSWLNNRGQPCRHRSPKSAIVILEADSIQPQVVKSFLEQKLKSLLPDNAENLDLSIYPEPGLEKNDLGKSALEKNERAPAYYHYSHGLKKHLGDCQRIAHGHRSKIEIYENDIRAPHLEHDWSQQWQDIYIGSEDDLVDSAHSDIPSGMVRFEYEAEQGQFMIQLARESCYLIDTESTVEQISIHIAQALKKQFPHSTFTVKAYEGVKKGAIATR